MNKKYIATVITILILGLMNLPANAALIDNVNPELLDKVSEMNAINQNVEDVQESSSFLFLDLEDEEPQEQPIKEQLPILRPAVVIEIEQKTDNTNPLVSDKKNSTEILKDYPKMTSNMSNSEKKNFIINYMKKYDYS